MLRDSPKDELVKLKNGTFALVCCAWADRNEQVVILARVFINETGEGFNKVVGEIHGPFFSQKDFNQKGAALANIWFGRIDG